MKILIFSPGYPDDKKSEYPFVKQLVDEWARQGHQCTVVATYSITHNKSLCRFKTETLFESGGKTTILRPNILSFSNLRFFGCSITRLFQRLGINYAINRIKDNHDLVYCHFWQSGYDGYCYSQKHKVPMFIATGESDIKKLLGDTDLTFLKAVSGVVCVSSKNKEESICLGLTTEDKCRVFPNAINPNIFCKLDKKECRKKLGIPLDYFVVAFVGSFKESKGADRLSDAIKSIHGEPVYSFFIGSGSIAPTAPNILYTGRLMHNEIPVYLNAADVFVLPTLAEGCCNAIVEAMACGLPIISSDLPFNWDVLNSDNSIMVNPINIQQLADAISELRDNPQRRESMSHASLLSAKQLTIDNRANGIIEFIKQRIDNVI